MKFVRTLLFVLIGLSMATTNVHAINPLVMNWFNSQVKPRFNTGFKRSYSTKLFSPSKLVSTRFLVPTRFINYGSTYSNGLPTIRYGNQNIIMIPGLSSICYNPFSFQKYRLRRLFRKTTQQVKKVKTRKVTDYQSLTPKQAYRKAQDLMEECMLNINEKKAFSDYIDEVVHIAHQYPDEMCSQLDLETVDDLINKLEEVKDTTSCLAVISTLRPYWRLLPETVRNTPRKTLVYNIWWRLSY